ncbi:NmrA domain-containing protein [Mycena indigotica]|uniref:NmrA domain-containing protein n=1 Tax=Mycena indigotica TaxID=2126181 RepID=A0A8H6SYV4_9AGAR|nr:NmrA domain-containing protein [Mycena indigotica]KAF7306430.1 NmrA domain-containing protein [Mycena indigotica]
MSSFTSFALFGAGLIGTPIVAGLVAKNLPIVVIARPGSKSVANLPAGAKSALVDIANAAAVAAVLKDHKVDVVISTLGMQAIAAQTPLIEAAKEAGIKLFVPSEFGFPTEGHTSGLLAEKYEISELLKRVGIPSLRIYTGMFMDFIPMAFGYEKTKKIIVIGKGEAPVSVTSVADITGFVVHVLTTLPPIALENKIFRIQGDRVSANDLGPLFGTTVEHVNDIPGPHAADLKALMLIADAGAGSTGWDVVAGKEGTGDNAAGSANKLWPDHQWKTIKEFYNL